MISGEAECFHVCFNGIKSPTGKSIPELGLFVFTDSLSIDYRMGPQWNIDAIKGLFELLLKLSNEFKDMKISHQGNLFDEEDVFVKAWIHYSKPNTADK